jgi:YHS domain-containing protein
MISRRTLLLSAAALAVIGAQTGIAQATLALQGYDVVAYFTEGGAQRGRAEHAAEWNDQTWHFTSASHRAAFVADPSRYAPQYGGYCAWAVARNYLAPVDPTAWAVVDGKLYLNFDARIQRRWARDPAGFIARANGNWPALRPNP